MRCPFCNLSNLRVTDSRNVENGIRRRRECQDCNRRFTTYERIQANVLMVTKRDNRREEFDREKLAGGIRKACAKRPVPARNIEEMVEDIELELQGLGQGEVAASVIGELVMERLRSLDRVAYIRYASVYRDFQDIESFEQVVKDLREGGGTQLTLPQIAPGRTSQQQRLRGGGAGEQRALQPRTPNPAPGSESNSEPNSEPGSESNSESGTTPSSNDGNGNGNGNGSNRNRNRNPGDGNGGDILNLQDYRAQATGIIDSSIKV